MNERDYPRLRAHHATGAPLLLALSALAAACGGGGGNGGPGPGPTAQATLAGDTLTTGPGERASTELRLRSNQPAAGLQVDLLFDPSVIPSIQSVAGAGRLAALGSRVALVNDVSPGRARVLLFDPGGNASIPPGDGPVLMLGFRTGASAPAGIFAIGLEDGQVVDQDGEPFDLALEPGQVIVIR